MNIKDKGELCTSCPMYKVRGLNNTGLNNPDILFVGSHPTKTDIRYGPFSSAAAQMVLSIVKDIQSTKELNEQAKITYTYAVRCCAEDINHKVNIDDIARCRPYLNHYINITRPKVILCFGIEAAKSLGYTSSLKALRGAILEKKENGESYKVIVTFHPYQVQKNPGLITVLKSDLQKALDLATVGIENIELDLSMPDTYEEVVNYLNLCIDKIEKNWEEKHTKLGIAIDTETTSLDPYRSEERMIMISLSWAHAQGLAYPWEHRGLVYTKEQYIHIKQLTESIINSDKAALVMFNAKFDIQWIRYRYGLDMKDVIMDSLIFEHLLDEDKKGEYSLKTVISAYYPSMGKYEEELHDILDELKTARLDRIAEAKKEYTKAVKEMFIDYWINISELQRETILSELVNSEVIQFSDTADLCKIKTVKRKGVVVPTKKYLNKIVSLLKKLPVNKLPGIELPEEAEAKFPAVTFEDVDLKVLLRYAAIDAAGTRMVAKKQGSIGNREEHKVAAINKKLIPSLQVKTKSLSWSSRNLSLPLCHAIAEMEYLGVSVDRDKIRSYQDILKDKMAEFKDEIFKTVGYTFNLSSSSPDLSKVLFENMRLPVVKTTDKGAPSTDAETLKELSEKHELPMLKNLLSYRKMEKTNSTYLNNWLKMSDYDGKLHCKFNQTNTATYRLSSSNPNLQNVPFSLKEANLNLKSIFIPDSDDFAIGDLDISNAEMRVLCAYSEDENLTKAFNEGMDLHCLTASGISDFTYEDILANKEDKTTQQYMQRQVAKKVNFGTVYCMSGRTLQQKLWADMRIKVTEQEANDYLNKFFEKYPGVKRYIDSTKAFAETYHCTYTYFGRRRRFPIAKHNEYMASRIARQAVNARIQSTSSDLVGCNLVDMRNYINPLGGRVLLTVHDSIVFQIPKGITGLKTAMDSIIIEGTAKRAPWLPVKWKYDVGFGENYGDAHFECTDDPLNF